LWLFIRYVQNLENFFLAANGDRISYLAGSTHREDAIFAQCIALLECNDTQLTIELTRAREVNQARVK
jgi:hypothetical protein